MQCMFQLLLTNSAAASRRRDAALELRLLRAEIGRAERMLQEEVSSALDSLKVRIFLMRV
jgi:hypothetical protein